MTAVGGSMLASTRFPTAASVAFLQARGDGRATVPIMDTPHGIDAAFDLGFVEERTLIDVEQQHDRRYWTGRLGVTEDVLRRAVSRVGVQASKVREYLRGATH